MVGVAGVTLDNAGDALKVIGPLVAILLALLRILISKRPQMRISVHEETTLLISDLRTAIPRFEASYDNAPIEGLHVSQFFVWNSGTESIKRDNVAPKEPLRIIFPKSIRILEFAILRVTDSATTFRVNIEDNTLRLSFDFLNLKDGAVIQVLHTGDAKDDEEIEVEGQLIGPRPDVAFTGDSHPSIHGVEGSDLTVFGRGTKIAGSVINMLTGALLILAFWFEWHWVGLAIGLMLAVIGFWTIIPSRSQIPKKLRRPGPDERSQMPLTVH